ncbi:MAG: metallophosphoesterase [Bacillota bacterium]|nr:metallophosphoesterase [Bacillota bacterium]
MLSKRKKFILYILAACILLAALIAYETLTLSVERVEVPIAGLPAELEGLTIAHLADLHGRPYNPAGKLTQAVRAANPDMISAAGDFVHNSEAEVDALLPLFAALTEIAPVYAVSGNHDHWTDWLYIAEALQSAGVEILQNRHIRLARNGKELIVAGVGDPFTGHDRLDLALPEIIDSPVVLIAHAPNWFEPLYRQRFAGTKDFKQREALLAHVDLVLAGHTHGGQIKFPLIGAVTTASGRLFPRTHVEGLIREKTSWLYISRGLGQSGFPPVRFLSRPELTILILRQEG